MHDMILYNYFRSSTSYRVRIALNLKSLNYTYKAVHLLEEGGQQYKPEYLALNPTAEVPTLIHGEKIIAQSFAIIEYLDEVYSTPSLLPDSAYGRAKVRQICENINCGIHPLTNLKVMQFLNKEMATQQNEKWQQHWITKGMSALEKILEITAGQFAFGNQVTCADIFIAPQVFSAERFGVSVNNFPLIKRINEACLELEAFKKAHPFRQPDTPNELKIN
jgi:maleylacetoacetate isomerase/maleylpyruvate isomerase